MKFSLSFVAAATVLASSACEAFSPAPMNNNNQASTTPAPTAAATDTGANDAMSQYEAALKAAFEQASASAVPSAANQRQEVQQQQQEVQQQAAAAFPGPTAEARIESNTALLEQVEQQEQAIDQYETALRAALESSSTTVAVADEAPPTIVFGREEEAAAAQQQEQQQEQEQQPDWANISRDISSRIEIAESRFGGPLDAAAKGEIVGTVLAGSAVLGTAAINSPLLMGAALGYAGTHVLGGKRGEALAEAGAKTFRTAFDFTRTRLEEEDGDISRASARIVGHLQNEALRNAREVTQKAQLQASQVSKEISGVPSQLVEGGKKIVGSEEVRQMPKRTFRAVRAFLGSEEVKRAREGVVKSIKEGLESEELRAVKERATRSLNDI